MTDVREALLRSDISVSNLCRASLACTRESEARHRAPGQGELWSYCLPSLLFLGVGQPERHLADELQELSILSLQLDDFRESRLAFRLLGDPAIDGVLGDAVVGGGLHDGYAFVFNAVDNLLLHVLVEAMLFHMLVC